MCTSFRCVNDVTVRSANIKNVCTSGCSSSLPILSGCLRTAYLNFCGSRMLKGLGLGTMALAVGLGLEGPGLGLSLEG